MPSDPAERNVPTLKKKSDGLCASGNTSNKVVVDAASVTRFGTTTTTMSTMR
jgi:hypothetical protein